MLGWLAAAAAPILIHLWSRRKYREMSWAAMEYLVAAAKRQCAGCRSNSGSCWPSARCWSC